jgi:N6-L-threonylcarbamoyladenine synthase
VRRVIVGGGVAANSLLRKRMLERALKLRVKLTIPKPALCTDNAAMVAAVGCRLISAGQRDPLSLDAQSRVVG